AGVDHGAAHGPRRRLRPHRRRAQDDRGRDDRVRSAAHSSLHARRWPNGMLRGQLPRLLPLRPWTASGPLVPWTPVTLATVTAARHRGSSPTHGTTPTVMRDARAGAW